MKVVMHTDGEILHVAIPDERVEIESPNILAYNVYDQKIVCIGNLDADLTKGIPLDWKEKEPDLLAAISRSFAVESFHAKFAVAINFFLLECYIARFDPHGSFHLLGGNDLTLNLM